MFSLNNVSSFIILSRNSSFNKPMAFCFFAFHSGFSCPQFKVSNFFQHLLQNLCKCVLFWYGQWSFLYPYNIILLSRYILLLRNHTKVHKFQFYLFIILINLCKQAYSWIFVFFSFLLLLYFFQKSFFVW